MTAPTPEQMRALADQLELNADAHQETDGTERRRAAAALRTAADQLEAVRELLDGMFDNGAVTVRAIRFALTRYGVNALPREFGHHD